MTDERTYGKDEVRKILELAANTTEPGRQAALDEGGLTLSEIQDAGHEAGIAPARIAEAALTADTRREALPRRTWLGAPASVGRVIDLPRPVTDREWDMLVVELREALGAKGNVTSHGSIREWTHGDLSASLEPTATGQRLRLEAHKGSTRPLMAMGATVLVLGLALLTLFVFEDLGRAQNAFALLIATMGGATMAATMVANMVSLPRWTGEREGQMDHIADRVAALLGESQPEDERG